MTSFRLPFSLRQHLLLLLVPALLFAASCSQPRVQLSVASQPNVNPDHTGRPSPVMIKMYELRSDLTFRQADFQTLFEQPVQTLGTDLVAADELVFIPGEARTVAYEPMPETRFVGIVAGFRQMERARWRVVVPVNPEKKNSVALELIDAAVVMIAPEEADGWDPVQAVQKFQQKMRDPALQTSELPKPAPASGSAASAPKPAQTEGYVLPNARRAQTR